MWKVTKKKDEKLHSSWIFDMFLNGFRKNWSIKTFYFFSKEMNPINMNLLQAIFINIFMLSLDTTAMSQGVAENTTLKKDDSRKNRTADDLIL